jgi:hypothetical protein
MKLTGFAGSVSAVVGGTDARTCPLVAGLGLHLDNAKPAMFDGDVRRS